MIHFEIDGRRVAAEEGQTILEALDASGLLMNGVEVPHYCWHPKLSIDGSCRLCQVEIDDSDELEIACDTVVRDGMVVRTRGERVARARAGVMELLLVNHPLDCPICDKAGECALQDDAISYGQSESRSREARRALAKNVDLGPRIVFDQERCILCRRCVRFCDEITGSGELGVLERGDRSVVDVFPGERLDNPYSMNVADLCPVGALTTKDFRFKMRVWFLEDVPALCVGCANGCNANLAVARGRVQRMTPRRNDAVNQTWLCDAGRLSYHAIDGPERLRRPLLRRADGTLSVASHGEAIEQAAARLARLLAARGPGVVAGLASGHASNEDLFTFRRFLAALGTDAARLAVVRGPDDGLLRKAEQAANAAGARAIGFSDAAPLIERIRGGGVDGLVVFGHELLHADWLGGTAGLEGLDTVIVLDSQRSALERVAHVMLPARHAAEKTGSYVNADGRVQRSEAAVEPEGEIFSEGALLSWLGAALGLEPFEGGYDVYAVSRALSASIPAFDGLDLDHLGPLGEALRSSAAGGDGRVG